MEKISVDLSALKKVISYLDYDEHHHYDAYENKPKNHIWISIKKLKSTIEKCYPIK